MKVLRFERHYTKREYDIKARHLKGQFEVFFPRWGTREDIHIATTEVYLVQVQESECKKVIDAVVGYVLADPLCRVTHEHSFLPNTDSKYSFCLEKWLKPGVTDNAGGVFAEAISLVCGVATTVQTGSRVWLSSNTEISKTDIESYRDEVFHNTLIERADLYTLSSAKSLDSELFLNPRFVVPQIHAVQVEYFDFEKMSIEEFESLSDRRLWALSRAELLAIQNYSKENGHRFSDVEIEMLAQTWSEHCKHKIFAAKINVTSDRKDLNLPAKVDSVFKTYIKGATREIPASFLRSIFVDNAGVISLNDKWDVAIKVETHNSPSALDPYGGALTGIVGVNRDILGVGLGSYPIANLDVFCVGNLDENEKELPPRIHHPRRILEGVRLGVEHGGNKSGIPTVTGALVHHKRFLGKPLVFCGTLGLLPHDDRLIEKIILPGDKVVMIGGRIGADGVHGATFSSIEMNESSPVSAVQLGDPLTQKRVWDFLIEARDLKLYTAVTDNGAGGLSSSIGELAQLCGKKGGAEIDLSKAAVKYPGLSAYELLVSESQERMTMVVPPKLLPAFNELASRRGVEVSVLGDFVDSGFFTVKHAGKAVAQMPMQFLHEGVPQMELNAHVPVAKPFHEKKLRLGTWIEVFEKDTKQPLQKLFPKLLSHSNICSRRWLTSQYDHEVQARSITKPYGSIGHHSPCDGSLLRIDTTSKLGVAIGIGLAPHLADADPVMAADYALDEAIAHVVCNGADPEHVALVDNFCWPDPLEGKNNSDPNDARQKLGALVSTCKTLYDAAIRMRMPFVSGKDSMKNDYRIGEHKISVPPTILITAVGKVSNVDHTPRHFFFGDEDRAVLWVSGQSPAPDALGHYSMDWALAARFYKRLHTLIAEGVIDCIHDVRDGGFLTATAEMVLGQNLKVDLKVNSNEASRSGEPSYAPLLGEPPSSFVVLAKKSFVKSILQKLQEDTVYNVGEIKRSNSGSFNVVLNEGETAIEVANWSMIELEKAYQELPWKKENNSNRGAHA